MSLPVFIPQGKIQKELFNILEKMCLFALFNKR